jgi:hypothetical protein
LGAAVIGRGKGDRELLIIICQVLLWHDWHKAVDMLSVAMLMSELDVVLEEDRMARCPAKGQNDQVFSERYQRQRD